MTVATEESLGTIDAAPAPPASIATPGAIPYQAVADHELERLGAHLPPIPVAVAGVFTGVFLATVFQSIRAIVTMGGEGFDIGSLLMVIVNALSLGVAATSAVFAYRGKADVAGTVASIRERARVSIPQEAGAPLSS
jgi:hypothetical protein